MKEKLRGFLPVILFFVVLNSIFIAGRSMLEDRGVDQEVLLLGNGLIFLITLVSFLVASPQASDPLKSKTHNCA